MTPTAANDSKARGRSRLIAVAAVVLAVMALATASTLFVDIAHVSSRPKVSLASGPQRVTLPPHAKYGLFFNDPNNSGYRESCRATDDGLPVVLSDPGFFVSSSNTDNLDLVFNTGSGNLVINCRSTAEEVSAKPVPDYEALLIRTVLAVLFGIATVVCTILWFAGIGARREPSGD